MLSIWNGNEASSNIKFMTINKAIALEELLKISPSMLNLIYNGVVVRQKKLQKGSVLSLTEVLDQ